MNKNDLIKLLTDLTTLNIPGTNSDISSSFEVKYEEVCSMLNCTYEDIVSFLNNIGKHYFSDSSISEWKYLAAGLYVLSKIGDSVGKSNTELLSVKETKSIKASIAYFIKLGIYTKLQPKLPLYISETYTKTNDIFFQYNILKCTILVFCEFLKNSNLRVLILSDFLKAILTGLYQIAYCPLNRNMPSVENVYDILIEEKKMAVALISKLRDSIHPTIYVKETMVIFQQNSPPWFKKAISQTLTNIMFSKGGVKNIAVSILDGAENDETKTWKGLDIIVRLLLSCRKRLDFRKNICQQVINLIDDPSDQIVMFESLFVICTKTFYLEDEEISKDVFVRKVITRFLQFTYPDYKFIESDITDRVLNNIRLIYRIFIETTIERPSLPTDVLKPVLGVIFRLYSLTLNTIFKEQNNELKEILLTFLTDHPNEDSIIFDSFLFAIDKPNQILTFRKDISLEIEGQIFKLKISQHSVFISVSERSDSIMELLKNNTTLLTRYFGYLLRCLADSDKYFRRANEELLSTETEFMNEYFERKLVTYKLLSTLAEDKNIQKQIRESPEDIITFIRNVAERTIKTNMHKTTEYESSGFQTIFTVVMILHALVTGNSKIGLKKFRILEEPLKSIKGGTKNKELVDLIEKILYAVEISSPHKMPVEDVETKSELDIILEDICDPLLPIRGHALMALKKLVEKKDASAIEKKQYVLTIFQESLKNDDSFIYLSAINGLAAMADVLSDSVLNTLCEEYSDFTRKNEDGHEVRIKLGEVLVSVTKRLGDMAPKYKALLLNTFLHGTKDEDHLVRSSSLSNLGEICRVLGYKLGTIVTEVLVCVHAIIATDKATEPRRAAVTVIRQLLTGLESEMISFLKEDILPIYRTLKQIYLNDKDDVMRLQAQLALEELNENMTNFVFPKPQINTEKKIIMLN